MCGCCDAVADAGDGDGSVSNLGSGRGGSLREPAVADCVRLTGARRAGARCRWACGKLARLRIPL